MSSEIVRQTDLVTFRVGSQWFGVSVLSVQEVLRAQRVARVPLAPRDVAGFLNLRGQIVTAVSLHRRLEISAGDSTELMNVVVRDGGELFALIVDEVGDVVEVLPGTVERLPSTLESTWGRACTGVVRRDSDLLAITDASRLLDDLQTCL